MPPDLVSIKLLYFSKTMESSDRSVEKKLKQKLVTETDKFLNENNIMQDKDKYKQLIRNLSELIEYNEVQFPSYHQIIINQHYEHLGNDLSLILYFLIRGDESMNHSKESDDKDKIRLQSIILFKNLQTTGIMGNIEMQCKILEHLIKKT